MKKILLVGKLNEIVRSLYQCLINDFQVQLCPEEPDDIKNMYQIVKPDMIIVSQIGIDEVDITMCEWIRDNTPATPVLIITISEKWNEYEPYFSEDKFDKMFRPVGKKDLLEKCHSILKDDDKNADKEKIKIRRKIMIVDDSAMLLRSVKATLDKEYTVYVATSGEQALTLVSKRQPDLILLDYEMPGMDGKMTYELLKSKDETKDIPVVFLTSVSDKEHIYSILETRPAGYILKPPDRDRLFQTIEDVFNNIDDVQK